MVRILIFFTTLIVWVSSYARDVTVLKLQNCQFLEGFIVGYDEQIDFLTLDGKLHKLNSGQIDLILSYGISDSPFKNNIALTKEIKSYYKDIQIAGTKKVITGFAFHFIDNLVFILDNQGKVIVLSLDEIRKINDFDTKKVLVTNSRKKYHLNYSNYAGNCKLPASKRKSSSKTLTPIRVLGDNIKIGEYLDSIKIGLRKFSDLQERTKFYYKPYLFLKARIGITAVQEDELTIPMYYQWATGQEFNFQSMNHFGGRISEHLPSFVPRFSFGSSMKSHFFHGFFEGNLLGLSAGTIPTTELSYTNYKGNNIEMNYNYIAFMGGDWGNFSVSFGGGYLSPVIIFNKEQIRSLSANSLTNAFRLGYNTKKIRLWAYAYVTDDKSSSTFDMGEQISASSKEGNISSQDILSYAIQADYYRMGASYQLTDTIELKADGILGTGKYSEQATTKNQVEFESRNVMLSLQKSFGHYITLKFLPKRRLLMLKELLILSARTIRLKKIPMEEYLNYFSKIILGLCLILFTGKIRT